MLNLITCLAYRSPITSTLMEMRLLILWQWRGTFMGVNMGLCSCTNALLLWCNQMCRLYWNLNTRPISRDKQVNYCNYLLLLELHLLVVKIAFWKKNYAENVGKLMKSQRNSFAKVFYRRLKKDPQEVEKTFFISLFNVKIEHLTLNKKERHKNFVWSRHNWNSFLLFAQKNRDLVLRTS